MDHSHEAKAMSKTRIHFLKLGKWGLRLRGLQVIIAHLSALFRIGGLNFSSKLMTGTSTVQGETRQSLTCLCYLQIVCPFPSGTRVDSSDSSWSDKPW